jgi:hypothetical protein
MKATLIFLLATLTALSAFAQGGPIEMGDSGDEPVATPPPKKGSVVGRRAAEKYMTPDAKPAASNREVGSQMSPSDHYLAIHLGKYVSDNAYRWGQPDNQQDVGNATVGVTYRIGEWVNSMDLALRLDYSSYSLAEGAAGKLSFSPIVTFPDATSRFPLYLGAGIGLGIFTKQLSGKSSLAFDYTLVLGARFFEVFANTGFFIEAGIKNSLFVFSDGQFNGTFVAVGPVFTF